ncbi:MAG: aminopeptidase P family protein [Clostridia bacterium]|nr:aminopeptidase P family protein [Clostridia bacterium]
MKKELDLKELEGRLNGLYEVLGKAYPQWDTAVILSKVNQYYFTGTMQDGMLLLKRNGSISYYVRRSYERALDESPLSHIHPMKSYRNAAEREGKDLGNVLLEKETVTLAIMERLKKHFNFNSVGSLDSLVLSLRAVKSPYELNLIREAGKQHYEFMTEIVPSLLREGISEAELTAEIYEKMVKYGHQGICRFAMFQTEMAVGQIGFGESSLYPTSFDGPGGAYGMYPAVPLVGSRERKLKKGDLVFVDVAYGVKGYHSDKTQVYSFGAKPPREAAKIHRQCMDVQKRLAELLKPGAIPSEIYRTVMGELSSQFKENFMGFGKRQVKFLGHGIGLHVDEPPVIAEGFDDPLEENMVIALEPKKGIAGVGMVGVEDTYIVKPEGGECVTGGGRDIIVI